MMLTLEAVDEILQAEDLEGLLALGAQRDEYAQEAAEIYTALISLGESERNDGDLAALVFGVWDHAFGPFGADEIARRRPVLDRIVKRLLARAAAGKVSAQRQAEIEKRL